MGDMSKEFLNAEWYQSLDSDSLTNADYRDSIDEIVEASLDPDLDLRAQVEGMCPIKIVGFDSTPFSNESAARYGSELADSFVDMFASDTSLHDVNDPCQKMKKVFADAAVEARALLSVTTCHEVGEHEFSFDEVWGIVGS